MKQVRYPILFLTLILSLASCWNGIEKPLARRFCFAFSVHELSLKAIQQMDQSSFPANELAKVGLVSAEIFMLDSTAFMICDGAENVNYWDISNAFDTLKSVDPNVIFLRKLFGSGNIKPLDRIFKLDQKAEYGASEGQLILLPENYARYVLTLEIVNDPSLLDEYKKIHAMGQIWPEITENMRTVGIKDMEIYLWNYRAFLIMDTRTDFDMQQDGERWSALPREKEWQEYVAKFQKVDPESKATEKWVEMEQR